MGGLPQVPVKISIISTGTERVSWLADVPTTFTIVIEVSHLHSHVQPTWSTNAAYSKSRTAGTVTL